MNNVLYYHVHLTDDPKIWSSIVIEQLKYLEDTHLMGNLSQINVRCITQDDYRNQMFMELVGTYKKKFDVEFVANHFPNDETMLTNRDAPTAFSEDVTLTKIWEDAQTSDNNILYIHTKGTTSFSNHLGPGGMKRHKEYYYWRQFMNWGVMERWRDCVHALNHGYDTAGANYLSEPLPHYSGNFWWTKSEHVRKLPRPIQKIWWQELKEKKPETSAMAQRMGDEMWLCSPANTKSYDIVEIPAEIRPLHACLSRYEMKECLR